MIDYGAFTPVTLLEALSKQLDFDFIEPCNSRMYLEFYREHPAETLRFLDNGLVELGRSIGVEELKRWYEMTHSNRVASPDRLGDWGHNKHWALETSKKLPKENVWVTLAGPTPLKFHLQNLWVKAKGFGGVCLPYKTNRVPVRNSRVHLFGFRKPERYEEYLRSWWVTLDTTEPINAALHDWEYQDVGFASFPRHREYFLGKWDSSRALKAVSNVRWFKREVLGNYANKPK